MFNLDYFSPYTTEVHKEYVPVVGHGAWLAVFFIIFLYLSLVMNKRSESLMNKLWVKYEYN